MGCDVSKSQKTVTDRNLTRTASMLIAMVRNLPFLSEYLFYELCCGTCNVINGVINGMSLMTYH